MNKKLILIIAMLAVGVSIFSEEMISEEQNSQNEKYLIQLNDNILTTIQMLEAFNEQGVEVYLIKNGEYYNAFLLDMAMQCSNFIEQIRLSEEMDGISREKQIRALIATIKPDVEFSGNLETEDPDENSRYLKEVDLNLNNQIATLIKEILEEEKRILSIGEVTQNYLRYHSHHFLFSLLQDFIEPSDFLSHQNRSYLVDIVRSVDDSLPKQ